MQTSELVHSARRMHLSPPACAHALRADGSFEYPAAINCRTSAEGQGWAANAAAVYPYEVSIPSASPRRRILMTADTVSEVWHYALELSRALLADGHEVALATMGAMPDRCQRREAAAVSGLELYPSAYKVLGMEDCWRDMESAGRWLLDIATTVNADVVHLNDFGHGNLPWKVPVLMVGHSCVLSWWFAVHAAPPPASWRRYQQHVKTALRAADLVVAPSSAMLCALRRHYGWLPSARVIPNGGNAVAFRTVNKGQYIFTTGPIRDQGKNIGALAAVAARLPWRICVAGPSREDGASVECADLCMLGALRREQIQGWLAPAPIYASPARYEPSGLSILDAALAGCALVLGDIASLRENWNDFAIFVDPDDNDALAHALRRLIADPSERERYGSRARARAKELTSAAMATAYCGAYSEMTEMDMARIPAMAG